MHTYDAVKEDIAAWSPKVRKGGVIAGHDYDWPEVRRAVDEAFPIGLGVANTSWFINKK